MKPGPLIILALLFAASFSGRTISFATAAADSIEKPYHDDIATEASGADIQITGEAPAPVEQPEPDDLTDRDERVVSSPAPIEADADQDTLLAAIKERAAALEKREAGLKERVRVLEVIEQRIDQKIVELKAAKADLESRLSFADTAAQNDISRLAKMYENMKPQKAGEIFNAMESSFAAGFLTEMNNESAALILTNMETDKAYAASVIIAGRNANIDKR